MHSPEAKTMTAHRNRRQATVNDNGFGPDADDGQSEDNNITFINTADDAVNTADMAAPDDAASTSPPAAPPDPADQPRQDVGLRDYSIRLTRPNAAPGRIIQLRGTPFVPNSSFSYQFTTADSTHAAEQLLYLEQSTRRDILTAINNLHRQFEDEMKALSAQEIKAAESLSLRRQLQSRELQLQQLYLKKMVELEKRMQKAGHLKMIVDI
jgi:hypothetical protein